MTVTIAAIIIGLLTGFSYALVRQSVQVQQTTIVPFLFRIHMPNPMKVLTEKEHNIIHERIDSFNLRTLTCFIAAILAAGLSVFFLTLVFYGGDARITGYLMAVSFAYVVANYNVNTSAAKWIRIVENDILARIIVKNQEASEFNTLDEYLAGENKKMADEYYKEMTQIADDLEKVAEECGLDPDRNYEESEESFKEFLEIMEKAQDLMRERYPNVSDSFSADIRSEFTEPREK